MARRTQYKLDQRDLLTAEPPFDTDRLRGLIGGASDNRYALPSDAEMVKLCNILNQWHAWFYAAQQLREINRSADEAAAAIETLQRILRSSGIDVLPRLSAATYSRNGCTMRRWSFTKR